MITSPFNEASEDEIRSRIRDVLRRVEQACESASRPASEVSVMAVTKTVSPKCVNLAMQEGVSLFGENRVQEFLSKREAYGFGSDKTHFIGHLQSNKVKQIIDKVSMIESVDSSSLAREIDRQAQKHGLCMPVLAEVNIGREQSKFGFLPNELETALLELAKLPNIKVCGLMSIPPKEHASKYLKNMHEIYLDISHKKLDNVDMRYLSMGMSGDFEEAIAYGASIVRIGRAMFGER